MLIRSDQLKGNEGYKLMSGAIVPRPIALVTSKNREGVLGAAPFSFFNAVSGTPPVLMVSIDEREPGVPKDTALNIQETGEFVVNLVDEALAESMNLCATPFPAGVSEVEQVGLATEPGVTIETPRLKESPVAFECRARESLHIERNTLILGDVLCFHIRDDLYENGRINPHGLNLVGRLAGATYSYTREFFELPRISHEEWTQGVRPKVKPIPSASR